MLALGTLRSVFTVPKMLPVVSLTEFSCEASCSKLIVSVRDELKHPNIRFLCWDVSELSAQLVYGDAF